MVEEPLELGGQGVALGEIAEPDGAAAHLVLVGRSYAAARGADLEPAVAVLAPAVEIAVERQDEGRILGHLEHRRRHPDAEPGQALDLLDERPGIDHDAVADHRELAAHDARGQEAQLVGDAVDDERMAGIVAALEAHHDLGAL